MNEIIFDMVEEAMETENLEIFEALIRYVERLVNALSNTIEAPSDWQKIGAQLAKEYCGLELELDNAGNYHFRVNI